MPELALTDKRYSILGGVLAWFRPAVAQVTAVPVARCAVPVPVQHDPIELVKRQWQQLNEIIGHGVLTAGAAQRLQKSASDRLDAAGYALEGLRAELVAMQQAPIVAVASATATVHPFEILRKPVKAEALAA